MPNARRAPSFRVLPTVELGVAFAAAVREAPMAYGRTTVDRAGFFEEALLVTYARVEGDRPPVVVNRAGFVGGSLT